MKRKIFPWFLMLLFGSFDASLAHGKTLKLDLEASQLTYGEKVFHFISGVFDVKKGLVVGGVLVLDVRGAPMINSDRYPTAKFKMKSWREIHSFAPGAPNLAVSGALTINGKTYPVETQLNYEPKDHGFRATGKTEFGKKKSMLHGEVGLKIVATSI
jgi:hypothetical protein